MLRVFFFFFSLCVNNAKIMEQSSNSNEAGTLQRDIERWLMSKPPFDPHTNHVFDINRMETDTYSEKNRKFVQCINDVFNENEKLRRLNEHHHRTNCTDVCEELLSCLLFANHSIAETDKTQTEPNKQDIALCEGDYNDESAMVLLCDDNNNTAPVSGFDGKRIKKKHFQHNKDGEQHIKAFYVDHTQFMHVSAAHGKRTDGESESEAERTHRVNKQLVHALLKRYGIESDSDGVSYGLVNITYAAANMNHNNSNSDKYHIMLWMIVQSAFVAFLEPQNMIATNGKYLHCAYGSLRDAHPNIYGNIQRLHFWPIHSKYNVQYRELMKSLQLNHFIDSWTTDKYNAWCIHSFHQRYFSHKSIANDLSQLRQFFDSQVLIKTQDSQDKIGQIQQLLDAFDATSMNSASVSVKEVINHRLNAIRHRKRARAQAERRNDGEQSATCHICENPLFGNENEQQCMRCGSIACSSCLKAEINATGKSYAITYKLCEQQNARSQQEEYYYSKDSDHVKTIILTKMRNICIMHPTRGTAEWLYKHFHSNIAFRRAVYQEHHASITSEFKQQLSDLFSTAFEQEAVSVSIRKRAFLRRVLLENEYTVSSINGIKVLVVDKAESAKLRSELLMTTGTGFGVDLNWFIHDDTYDRSDPLLLSHFMYGPASLNDHQKQTPLPWISDKRVVQNSVAVTPFIHALVDFIYAADEKQPFEYGFLYDDAGTIKILHTEEESNETLQQDISHVTYSQICQNFQADQQRNIAALKQPRNQHRVLYHDDEQFVRNNKNRKKRSRRTKAVQLRSHSFKRRKQNTDSFDAPLSENSMVDIDANSHDAIIHDVQIANVEQSVDIEEETAPTELNEEPTAATAEYPNSTADDMEIKLQWQSASQISLPALATPSPSLSRLSMPSFSSPISPYSPSSFLQNIDMDAITVNYRALYRTETKVPTLDEVNNAIDGLKEIGNAAAKYIQVEEESVSQLLNIFDSLCQVSSRCNHYNYICILKQLYAHPLTHRVIAEVSEKVKRFKPVQSEKQFIYDMRPVFTTFEILESGFSSHQKSTARIISCMYIYMQYRLHVLTKYGVNQQAEKCMTDDRMLKSWIESVIFGTEPPANSKSLLFRYRHYYYSAHLSIVHGIKSVLFGVQPDWKATNTRRLSVVSGSKTYKILTSMLADKKTLDISQYLSHFVDTYLR